LELAARELQDFLDNYDCDDMDPAVPDSAAAADQGVVISGAAAAGTV
jgi:hypothetical protein